MTRNGTADSRLEFTNDQPSPEGAAVSACEAERGYCRVRITYTFFKCFYYISLPLPDRVAQCSSDWL